MKSIFLYLLCLLIKMQSFVMACDDRETRTLSANSTSPSKLLIVRKRLPGNSSSSNKDTDIESVKILGAEITLPPTIKVFDLFANANGYQEYRYKIISEQFQIMGPYASKIDRPIKTDIPCGLFYSKGYPVYFCVTPNINELITFSGYLKTLNNQMVSYQYQQIITQFMDGFNQIIDTPSTSIATLKDLQPYFNPRMFQHASLEALLETYGNHAELMKEIAAQDARGEREFEEATKPYIKKQIDAWEMLEKGIKDKKKSLEAKKDEESLLKARKIEAKFLKSKSNFEKAWREVNHQFENLEQELIDDPDALKALELKFKQECDHIWQVFAKEYAGDKETFIKFREEFIEADTALAAASKAFNTQYFENYVRLIYQNVFTSLLVKDFQNDLDVIKEIYDLTHHWHLLTRAIITTLGSASTKEEGTEFYDRIISPWLRKLFLNSHNYFYDISMFFFNDLDKSHHGTRMQMVKFKAGDQVFSMVLFGNKPKPAKKEAGCIVS